MLHPRTMPANVARGQFALDVYRLLEAADLTDAEALQALGEVQLGIAKGLLRAERHRRHPKRDDPRADEACDVPRCPGYRA